MPIYTDKRTGKKVIQYQIGFRNVPDPKNSGKLIRRPKYKTEVVGKSARVARKKLARKEAEWEQKKYLEEFVPEIPRPQYIFGELMAWYLELPVAKKKRSYTSDVEKSKPVVAYFGKMAADKIKPSMVESFQDKILKSKHRFGAKYKPATVNRMVALMKRVFNLAIREDMVLKNPCWKVTRLSEKNARDRVLSMDEFEKLVKALPQHAADIVTVAYYTDMRVGEIFSLTWDSVNMKEGYFNLTPQDTKTGEARHVYFNSPIRDILERIGKVRQISHRFVFTYHGNPVKSIKYALTGALKKTGITGIQNFRFHDLRHTYVSNARKAGVDRTVIMRLTGHKTLSMFTRYNTVDQADAREALKRLDSFFSRKDESTAAIVLQAQKRGQDKSPNPLNLLAPRAGLEPAT